MQQGAACQFDFFLHVDIESSAQIATPEVLANMALEGNAFALFSLVDFMREMSMNAAKYKALEDPKLMPNYLWLTRQVYRKASEQAKLEQTNHSAVGFEEQHKAFLNVYNYEPLKKLLLAHKYTKDVVSELVFPNKSVTMDDFGDFMERGDTLVAEYAKKR